MNSSYIFVLEVPPAFYCPDQLYGPKSLPNTSFTTRITSLSLYSVGVRGGGQLTDGEGSGVDARLL